MRVSLNALSLRPDGAGVSTYVRELLRAMPPGWQAACTALVQEDASADLPALTARRTVSPRAGVRRAASGLLQESLPDVVLHGTDVDLPLRLRGPTVVTVHDVSVFDTPWAFSAGRVRGERLLVRHALRRADEVLAVSDFTADRVRALFGRTATVTPLAAAPDLGAATPEQVASVRQRYGLPARFVLHVGTVEPRKDVPRLIDACRELDVPLVLVGGGGDQYLPAHARRLGFVPREDLPALYGAAAVTAYVSLYEGFGLPPVEALACGATVVCSPVADLRELLGDRVTWTSGARVQGLVGALRRALAGEPRDGSAPELSWEATARRTIRVYERLGARVQT